MTYVIKSWSACERPDDSAQFIAIEGRREGIVSWVLARFGIDPTVSISVSESRIEFSETSLSGSVRRLIPLASVCSTVYGYHKPWKRAVVLALFLIWFITGATTLANEAFSFAGFLGAVVVGTVLALLYHFVNRTLTLGFVEHSGVISAIQFKRSIVENQDINEAQAGYVCEIVQALVEGRQRAVLQV